ncbi:hypothetical protein HHI36_016983 [Cryptolaemus montrouzieri]|uniref:Uncharacterized protein n=1 Tax=Cryptolaemus montrouzieri TaxID=559131 RepID=A0ABD2NLC1_9CUCU
MEVNRLLSNELAYELPIRKLPSSGNVADKRIDLRGALRAEKAGEREVPSSCNFNPSYELTFCSSKLAELQEMIERFNISNRTNEFKRISTRLLHVEGRLSRIVCDTSELIHHRSELLELQQRLTQDLIWVYESSIKDDASCQHLSLPDAPVPLLPEIVNVPAHSLVDPQADSSEGLSPVENLILSENRRQEFGRVEGSRVAALRRLFTEGSTSTRLDINDVLSMQGMKKQRLVLFGMNHCSLGKK